MNPSDRPAILDVIDSRVKSGVHTSVMDFRRMMLEDQTFDQGRVFGTFDDTGLLRSFIFVRPINNWCYLIIFMIARRAPLAGYTNSQGYNLITQTMIEYCVREMEKDGFYVNFVARPTNKKWIRTEENPDRQIKNEYTTSVIEVVPPDTDPVSKIGQALLRRFHDEEMEIVCRRRIKGREDVPE